jgi:hypothetical protein
MPKPVLVNGSRRSCGRLNPCGNGLRSRFSGTSPSTDATHGEVLLNPIDPTASVIIGT